MGGTSLPPGFRFHPTDEELIGYYLKRKVEGLEIELEVIPVVKLYKFDPWELPEKSFLPNYDMEWFFFCPRDRKYPNGSRTNRATNAGYWKATGKDRKVFSQSAVIGFRKTLVFYRGRAPLGDRTHWLMHEYRLCDDVSQQTRSSHGPFVLCRVMKKNEQKTSYVNSDPKVKEAGVSSSNEGLISDPHETLCQMTSNFSSPLTSPYHTTYVNNNSENELISSTGPSDPTCLWVSPDLILDSSKEQSHEGYFAQNEFPNAMTAPWQPCDQFEFSSSSSYSNFTEEVELNQFSFGNENFMGFFGNDDRISYEDYDWTKSLGNLEPF